MSVLALTLPAARRNPVRAPRRDLVAPIGGGLTLRVSLVPEDRPGALPIQLWSLAVRMWLVAWPDRAARFGEDYGRDWFGQAPPAVVTEPEYATAAEPRHVDIPVPAMGRGPVRYALMAASSVGTMQLCCGTLHPGAVAGGVEVVVAAPAPGPGTDPDPGTGPDPGTDPDPDPEPEPVPAPPLALLLTSGGAPIQTHDGRSIVT